MIKYYMGIDVGSVSTNLILMDEKENVYKELYIRTEGKPIAKIKEGLETLKDSIPHKFEIGGVGTTGSGRNLAGIILGADIIKNEITAHAVAALKYCPEVKTVFEIGGQDSKIIFIKNGIVSDFAMNTVCAAGTGSFIDRQAARLNIPISQFGEYALKSKTPISIAGRCAVFAESDMIHKQQCGHNNEDIINGLCEALVRNYLNNLAKGKTVDTPIVFQGGVAANIGIVKAFERELNTTLIIPPHHHVMGAIGVALLAKAETQKSGGTHFVGFEFTSLDIATKSFECKNCSNNCEVVEVIKEGTAMARWGDRCGKWGIIKKGKQKLAPSKNEENITVILEDFKTPISASKDQLKSPLDNSSFAEFCQNRETKEEYNDTLKVCLDNLEDSTKKATVGKVLPSLDKPLEIERPLNPVIDKPINPRVDQPINPTIDQPINPTIDQPINPNINTHDRKNSSNIEAG